MAPWQMILIIIGVIIGIVLLIVVPIQIIGRMKRKKQEQKLEEEQKKFKEYLKTRTTSQIKELMYTYHYDGWHRDLCAQEIQSRHGVPE